MDVLALLEQLDEQVTRAPAIPLSGQVRLERDAVCALVDQLRTAIPAEILKAQDLLVERAELLDAARREAEEIVRAAREASVPVTGDQVEVLEARLAEIARAVEEVGRSGRGAAGPLAEPTLARVRPIVQAAELAAAEVRREAREDAERMADDARRQAAELGEQAAADIAAYLVQVESETAEMLGRGRALLERREPGGGAEGTAGAGPEAPDAVLGAGGPEAPDA